MTGDLSFYVCTDGLEQFVEGKVVNCSYRRLVILKWWRCSVLWMQLMSHPFIKKYEEQQVDLAGFVQSVFDPTERLKDLSDVSLCEMLGVMM